MGSESFRVSFLVVGTAAVSPLAVVERRGKIVVVGQRT